MALTINKNTEAPSVYKALSTLSKYIQNALGIKEYIIEIINNLPDQSEPSTKYVLEISTFIISDINSDKSTKLLNEISDACQQRNCECIIRYHSPVLGTPAYIATRISEPSYRTISCKSNFSHITFKPMNNIVRSDHGKTVELYKQTDGGKELMRTIVTSFNLFLTHNNNQMNSFISIDHCSAIDHCSEKTSKPTIITTPYNPLRGLWFCRSPEKLVIDQVVDLIKEAKNYIYLDQTHLSDPGIKQALCKRIQDNNVDIYINMPPQFGGRRMLGCSGKESLVDYYLFAKAHSSNRVYISIPDESHAKLVAIDDVVIAGSTNLHRSSRWGVIRETDVKFKLEQESQVQQESQEVEDQRFSQWMILQILNGPITCGNFLHYYKGLKNMPCSDEDLKIHITEIVAKSLGSESEDNDGTVAQTAFVNQACIDEHESNKIWNILKEKNVFDERGKINTEIEINQDTVNLWLGGKSKAIQSHVLGILEEHFYNLTGLLFNHIKGKEDSATKLETWVPEYPWLSQAQKGGGRVI